MSTSDTAALAYLLGAGLDDYTASEIVAHLPRYVTSYDVNGNRGRYTVRGDVRDGPFCEKHDFDDGDYTGLVQFVGCYRRGTLHGVTLTMDNFDDGSASQLTYEIEGSHCWQYRITKTNLTPSFLGRIFDDVILLNDRLRDVSDEETIVGEIQHYLDARLLSHDAIRVWE